jgi:1-acyl-sn-glycerol-3-phosphate acyltransferase
VIGMPADEIVLAPLNAVLKTSSGKIRRAATRDAFERGLIGARVTADRQQLLRLGVAAVHARLSESAGRLARSAYGLWCWGVFLLLALPVLGLVISIRVPAIGRRIVHRAARLFLALAGMPLPRVAPAELPQGPHLLLVNHCSYFDALVLCAALPPAAAYSFVAKREFVDQALIHAFLRALGTLFVERFEASKSAEDVDEIVTALRQGRRLVIFPEGTFSREAGLKPFRMGAFVAAVRAPVPVLAGGLQGTILETSVDDPRALRHARCAGCSGRTEAHPLGEMKKIPFVLSLSKHERDFPPPTEVFRIMLAILTRVPIACPCRRTGRWRRHWAANSRAGFCRRRCGRCWSTACAPWAPCPAQACACGCASPTN